MKTVSITRRSQNLGYAYNTTPNGDSPYRFDRPTTPTYTGRWQDIEAERRVANSLNCDMAEQFFIGGKAIVGDRVAREDFVFDMRELHEGHRDSVTVTVEG